MSLFGAKENGATTPKKSRHEGIFQSRTFWGLWRRRRSRQHFSDPFPRFEMWELEVGMWPWWVRITPRENLISGNFLNSSSIYCHLHLNGYVYTALSHNFVSQKDVTKKSGNQHDCASNTFTNFSFIYYSNIDAVAVGFFWNSGNPKTFPMHKYNDNHRWFFPAASRAFHYTRDAMYCLSGVKMAWVAAAALSCNL